jgi:hypothetical protein
LLCNSFVWTNRRYSLKWRYPKLFEKNIDRLVVRVDGKRVARVGGASRNCGYELSVWERGGIRWKAAGRPIMVVKCPKCGKTGPHDTYIKI